MTWQKHMRELKLQHIKASTPGFYEASGGSTMYLPAYNDRTANGLTRCIMDFLKFKGHYANRINTQGQARVSKAQRFNIHSGRLEDFKQTITWTPSATRRGTPDIDAIIHGQPVKIEVKAGSDRMSQDQERERARIEHAGGHYFIARDMQSFLKWYELNFQKNASSERK